MNHLKEKIFFLKGDSLKATLLLFLVLSLFFDSNILYYFLNVNINIRYLILLIFLLVSIVYIIKKKFILKANITLLYIIVMYLGWLILSLSWNNDPINSLGTLIGVIIGYIFSYYLGVRYKRIDIYKAIGYSSFIVSILSIILFIFVDRDLAINREDFFRFKGIMIHSQSLSSVLCISNIIILYSVINIHNKKILWYFIFTINTLMIMLTYTRSFTTVFFIVSFYILYKKTNYNSRLLIIIIITLITVIVYIYFSEIISILYQRGDSDIVELTGRTLLWLNLIPEILQSLWIGHGFGTFREGVFLINSWYPSHAHNLWLQKLYEIGIIGTLLYHLIFLVSINNYKNKNVNKLSIIYYLIIFLAISGITSVIIGRAISPIDIILITIIFSFNYPLRGEANDLIKINKRVKIMKISYD